MHGTVVGQPGSFSFSRMRPKKSGRMEQLPAAEQESMRSLLQEYYRDYTLFFSNGLFKDNGYYVIRDSGRVVAGVQYYPVTWRIVDFGGGLANQAVRLLIHIPWVRKRINPGILHRVLGSFTGDVRMRFINIPDGTRQRFLDQPTYIPTYDNS